MKKSVPRGSFEERVSIHDGIDLNCVAWKNNKIVGEGGGITDGG